MDKDESISKVADIFPTNGKQHISNKTLVLKMAPQPGGRDSSNNSSNSSQQPMLNT